MNAFDNRMRKGKIGKNLEVMQAENRSLILHILAKRENCSRTDISRETGLTMASVSKIIGEMVQSGIVIEGNDIVSGKGRHSISLSINHRLCKVVAVKLARETFDVGVYEFGGNLIEKTSQKINQEEMDPTMVLVSIKKCINWYIDKYPDIASIAVAVPGPFLRNKGRIGIMSEFSGWENVNLEEEFRKEFIIPVSLEHDANSAAIAEWAWSEKSREGDNDTLISIVASEGIGAGIVNDGELLLGSEGIAGEIGHMSIDVNGPKCSCGNRGCLELYCSALAFMRRISEHLPKHPESSLNQEETITLDTVFHHMQQGDPFAVSEVKRVGTYLGYGLANIIYLYNPREIILTDLMTGGGEILLNQIRQVVKERTLDVLSQDVEIRYSKLAEDPILLGAAVLATENLLNKPHRLYRIQAGS